LEQLEALVTELRTADDDRIEAIKEALEEACRTQSEARSWLEFRSRSEVLPVQWEIEEVLDATAPKVAPEPVPEPEPEPEPEEERPLTAADLDLVYDDPRGLALHRTKDEKRWFATQVHPQTRQPQTFELSAAEISQLKMQLAGSPYWAK
jgi:hypothetical protein